MQCKDIFLTEHSEMNDHTRSA